MVGSDGSQSKVQHTLVTSLRVVQSTGLLLRVKSAVTLHHELYKPKVFISF